MAEEAQKWTGSVSANLQGVTPDEAWSLLNDFCGLHKFHLPLATSNRIDGEDNEPGCVRYCSRTVKETGQLLWAKERLLEIDMVGRSYSYDITESNMGTSEYFAMLKVVSVDGGEAGCKIEWSFAAAPLVGWTREGFMGYIKGVVEGMGKTVAEVVSLSNAN